MVHTIHKRSLKQTIGFFTLFSLIAMLVVVKPAEAAQITSAKDTLTRLKKTTTADHTVVFTLPTGVTFDDGDKLEVDFPESSAFVAGGTWVTGDFTFNDGTARTVNAVAQGAGTETVTCTDAVNNVGVAIDTTDLEFRVIPCGAAYTASASAATVTFTIDGTTTDGTLTNPTTVASYTVVINHDNDGSVAENSSSISIAIVEEDTVTVTASVDPSLTFDIDVAFDTSTETDPAAVPLALGTLTSGSVTTSNNSTVRSIFMDLSTNAGGGVVVTVRNTDTVVDLASTSVPADTISAVSSPPAAVVAGTEGFGICVVASTASTGTLTQDAEYDGDGSNNGCTASTSDNTVGVPPSSASSPDTLVSSTGPIAGGDIEVAVKAAISGVTQAHSDYTDAMTFIATATF